MNGKITISRYSSNYDMERPVRIRIEDGNSGINFIEIALTLEDFANAVTGMGYVECQFEVRGLDKIGKRREVKTEVVKTKSYNVSKEEKLDLLKPFEVDGWIGSLDDLGNYHNRKDDGYSVGFVRWVEDDKD